MNRSLRACFGFADFWRSKSKLIGDILIKTITFIRNANTIPSTNDSDRVLSEEGIAQVEYLATMVEAYLPRPKFDLFLVSPARRTRQTATLLLRQLSSDVEIIAVDQFLHNPRTVAGSLLESMLSELGYTTLHEYRRHQHAAVLEKFAQQAAEALTGIIDSRFTSKGINDVHIGVCGHAILIPAIAAELCKSGLSEVFCLLRNLGECESLTLNGNGNGVYSAAYIPLTKPKAKGKEAVVIF